MKLRELIDLFLDQYKPSTRKSYENVLMQMLEFIGNRPIDQVKTTDLVAYHNELKKQKPNPNTINKHIKCMKSFYNRVRDWGVIQQSPADAIHVQRVPLRGKQDKAMPDEELEKLIQFIRVNTRSVSSRKIRFYRGLALVLFLADSGVRIDGARTLTVENLNLKDREALVTEKGEQTHLVYFGPSAREALKAWIILRKGNKGDYVFTYRGELLAEKILNQFFRRLCIDAGIGSWGPHSLRHRLGVTLSQSGVPVTTVSMVLNHKYHGTTMDYYFSHDPRLAKEAVDRHAIQSEEDSKIIKLPKQRKS